MFRGVVLFAALTAVNAAFEGDTCNDNGVTGVCINIYNCPSALSNEGRKKRPKTCGFDKATPIVCCLDSSVTAPLGTTTKRPLVPQQDYEPPTYDYETAVSDTPDCDPVDPSLTKPKTGQKSWDKCVEYQERLVYPCQKSVALISGYQRKSYCFHNADELIVNGEDAAPNEFPHMALLGFGDDFASVSWQCGGSLISERFILTAGHCVASSLGNLTYASLGVLARSQVAPSNSYKIKNIFRHPQYRIGVYNDIALLELEKDAKLSEFVVPACLHIGDSVDDERATATGWGLLGSHANTSDILQKVVLNKMPTAECQRLYKSKLITHHFDKTTQICYGDRNAPKDTCKGDSGGPLQLKHKHIKCMYIVLGVTSGGTGCAWRKTPGLYSKVEHHLKWIESIVWP